MRTKLDRPPPSCTVHEALYVPPPSFRIAQDLSELEGFIYADPELSLLVILPPRRRPPEERSLGTKPRKLISSRGESKRVRSPGSASTVVAVLYLYLFAAFPDVPQIVSLLHAEPSLRG